MILWISVSVIFHKGKIPFVRHYSGWSIGIYTGDSPTRIAPASGISNPVLTAVDITDCPADYVADPFMILQGKMWHMFFEIKRSDTHKGVIGTATSIDGKKWKYNGIVLSEPFHLSYPYVFQWGAFYYMIPETVNAHAVRLYRAANFPSGWIHVKTLLDGVDLVDPSIFQAKGIWWMLAASPDNSFQYLYYANDLMGPWIAHPSNPVVREDMRKARCGGRVLVTNDGILRFTQDDRSFYGSALWGMRITELSTTAYHEEDISNLPILRPGGTGWRTRGMHTADIHDISNNQWIACVDGYGSVWSFSFNH
jgi:hypothetical protein